MKTSLCMLFVDVIWVGVCEVGIFDCLVVTNTKEHTPDLKITIRISPSWLEVDSR